MDATAVIGWSMAAWGVGTLLGFWIGHSAALRDQERQNDTTSDRINDL